MKHRKFGLSEPERLAAWLREQCVVDPMTECWVWQRAKNGPGYGLVHLRERQQNVFAHRLSAHLYLGFDLDSPLVVMHTCDNPPCINPEHLRPGTHSDNLRDAVSKGRHRRGDLRGEEHGSARITEADVRAIWQAHADGDDPSDLAARFGVDRSHISRILLRQAWGHLEGGPPPSRPGQLRGEKAPGVKLTADDVRAIRRAYADGAFQHELAALYKVRRSTISAIVRRETWKHLDD